MNPTQDTIILPFQPENQVEVKELILAGLAEHWGTMDSSMNPDLDAIGLTYAKAVFLVAWDQGKIVGTGALIPESSDTARIVRMSVAAEMRRNGVGSKILQRLCEQAKSMGYQRLVLETVDTWQEAIAFYKRFGFQITDYLDGDVHFALHLS